MIRSRLSFSNVVSVVALFIALGGGAYALQSGSVGSKDLKDNGVKSKDLKDNSVKAQDLKDETIGAADIGSGAVGSSEVVDDSLEGGDVTDNSITGADVNESTLSGVTPSGPAGGDLTGTYPNPGLAPGTVGTAEHAALPHARATSALAQTVPDGTVTKLQLTALQFGSAITFNNADDSLTITVPGVYLVSGDAGWTSNATGRRTLQLRVNDLIEFEDSRNAVSSSRTTHGVFALIDLDAGDVLTLHGQQTSGGDLTMTAGAGRSSSLSAVWVSP